MGGLKRKRWFSAMETNGISEALNGEIIERSGGKNVDGYFCTVGVLLRRPHGNVFIRLLFDEEVIEVYIFRAKEPFPPKLQTEKKEKFHLIQFPKCKGIYYLAHNTGGGVVFEDKDNRHLEITPRGFVYQHKVFFENF